MRTIRVEDVDAGIEWLRDHELLEEKPAESRKIDGGEPENSQKIDGVETASEKSAVNPQPTTPPVAANPQATSSQSAAYQPPTLLQQPPTSPVAVNPQATTKLEVPAGVEPTPISAIDRFIQQGYVTQTGLETIMKHNYNRKAFRKEILDRLALYRTRQPPFNGVIANPTEVVGGGLTADRREIVGGGVVGDAAENTHISAPSPPTSSQQSAVNPQPISRQSAVNQQPTSRQSAANPSLPAELDAARNMTDTQIIRQRQVLTPVFLMT